MIYLLLGGAVVVGVFFVGYAVGWAQGREDALDAALPPNDDDDYPDAIPPIGE